MRANYLDDAMVSFKKARKLSPMLDNRNLEALQEHLDHRAAVQAERELAMNPNYARIGKFSSEVQEDEKGEAAIETTAAAEDSESKEVTVDLLQPLGVTLWPGLLIESVTTGGQLEVVATAGDRVLSVGSTPVWSFDQLKVELEAMKNAGLPSAVLTVAHNLKKTNATPTRASSSGSSGSGEDEESVRVKEAVEHLSNGNLESALASFQAAVELSPQKGELWANVGNVQRDLGLIEEALQSYERGLALDPESDLLLTNLEELRASQSSSGGALEKEGNEGAGFCDDGVNTEVWMEKKIRMNRLSRMRMNAWTYVAQTTTFFCRGFSITPPLLTPSPHPYYLVTPCCHSLLLASSLLSLCMWGIKLKCETAAAVGHLA
jgi:tetratricopeptide (TPR) repeat protein